MRFVARLLSRRTRGGGEFPISTDSLPGDGPSTSSVVNRSRVMSRLSSLIGGEDSGGGPRPSDEFRAVQPWGPVKAKGGSGMFLPPGAGGH